MRPALRAGVASTLGSITTQPGVPDYLAERIKSLGLDRSTYLAILLHNYLHGPPVALPVVSVPPRRLTRPKFQVSLPAKLRRDGQRAAKRWGLSFSQLVTALVVHDADNGLDELVIHPVRGTEKPELPAWD